MDELLLLAAVAVPLLAAGAISWLAIRRVGHVVGQRVGQRAAAGIVVLARVCALIMAGLWTAVDGLTSHSLFYAVTGVGLIALYLPRMRRRAVP